MVLLYILCFFIFPPKQSSLVFCVVLGTQRTRKHMVGGKVRWYLYDCLHVCWCIARAVKLEDLELYMNATPNFMKYYLNKTFLGS